VRLRPHARRPSRHRKRAVPPVSRAFAARLDAIPLTLLRLLRYPPRAYVSTPTDMGKENESAKVLATWVERDLSAAAAAGELCPAFHVDAQVRRLADLLASGRRPILAGPSGSEDRRSP
jgi:hypothetical protein